MPIMFALSPHLSPNFDVKSLSNFTHESLKCADSFNLLVNNGAAAGQVIYHVWSQNLQTIVWYYYWSKQLLLCAFALIASILLKNACTYDDLFFHGKFRPTFI